MPERVTFVLPADSFAVRDARHAVRAKGDQLGFSDMGTATVELLTTELVLNCLRLGTQEVTLHVVTAEPAGTMIQVVVAASHSEPIVSAAFPDEVATRVLERYATGWGFEDDTAGRSVSFVFRDDTLT